MIELSKLVVHSNQNKVQPHFKDFNQTFRDQLAVIPIIYLRLPIHVFVVIMAMLVGLATPLLVENLGRLFYVL